jgi:carboxypeptidase Taq
MSLAKLEDLGRKLEALAHARAMLGVDEAVQMPVGGGEKRAEAMAMLAGLYHDFATAPEIADWIEAAANEDLDATGKAAVREFKRVYRNMTCLSSDFVRRQVGARVRSEQLWRELRPKGDGAASFRPLKAWSRPCARRRSFAPRPWDSIRTTP